MSFWCLQFLPMGEFTAWQFALEFYWPLVSKIYFDCFLVSLQKTKTNKWWIYVTNHVTYFCDRLTELALQVERLCTSLETHSWHHWEGYTWTPRIKRWNANWRNRGAKCWQHLNFAWNCFDWSLQLESSHRICTQEHGQC